MEQLDILLLHGLVVTMDAHRTILADGAVGIKGAHIAAIGSSAELGARYQAKVTLDATGKLVMPGLINTHTHGPDSLFRGLVEDLPLERWLAKLWVAEEAFIKAETVRWGAALAYIEMVKAGITLATDMFWFPEAMVEAAQQIGFRLMTGPVYMDAGAGGIPLEEWTAYARQFLLKYRDDPLIVPCVQPHSVYTVTPTYLEQAGKLAQENEVMFVTHASETEKEVRDCIRQYGVSPVKHLDRLGLLSDWTLLAHCVHLEEDEFELLERRGTRVAHCPVSNLKIASGIANIARMHRVGVKVTLGTDGPVSGNDLNPWFTLRLAALLQKGSQLDSALFPAADMVAMVTCDAAQALHLGDRLGSIEPGKLADLITVRMDAAHAVPCYDPYALLVYSTGREDVDDVIINGNLVVRQQHLTTLDESQVLEQGRNISQDVINFMRGQDV